MSLENLGKSLYEFGSVKKISRRNFAILSLSLFSACMGSEKKEVYEIVKSERKTSAPTYSSPTTTAPEPREAPSVQKYYNSPEEAIQAFYDYLLKKDCRNAFPLDRDKEYRESCEKNDYRWPPIPLVIIVEDAFLFTYVDKNNAALYYRSDFPVLENAFIRGKKSYEEEVEYALDIAKRYENFSGPRAPRAILLTDVKAEGISSMRKERLNVKELNAFGHYLEGGLIDAYEITVIIKLNKRIELGKYENEELHADKYELKYFYAVKGKEGWVSTYALGKILKKLWNEKEIDYYM